MSAEKTVQLAINTIRSLAIDAIQKANSGHPGTPLDAAPTAYTLWQQVLRARRCPDGKPDVILIGCGSEVSLCVQASERLTAEGIKTRVVSMPTWQLFDEQDQQYQNSVLPPSGNGGGGLADWLGTLRWTRRRSTGYAHLRHVCADEDSGRAFRLYS